MDKSLKRELHISGQKAEYDEYAKRILAQKIILAHILVNAVSEFAGIDPENVVELIEGEPEVASSPVNPGESNWHDRSGNSDNIRKDIAPAISGSNTESKIPYEGTITYDIRFFVWLPGKAEKIKIIVDIEAQKNFNPGYDIVSRGIFYGARMISAQLDTEFRIPKYSDIKKVYSIWICMNTPDRVKNTITEFQINKKNVVGISGDMGRYDLLGVIVVGLSKELAAETDQLKLHRLLGTLFVPNLSVEEKMKILSTEFGIRVSEDLERSARIMCNLSEAIEEKGREEGREEGLERGKYQELYDLVQDGVMSIEQASKRKQLTEDEFLEKLKLFEIIH